MTLQERVNQGLKGEFKGLNNGFKDINEYIFGVQKHCYTLIGGMSGTYKTTLLDYIFLNAIQDAQAKGKKLDVFYYSFEIDKLTKQCNWLSQLAWKNYNVIIPPKKIKGLGDNRLSNDEQEIINTLIPKVEKLFESINWVFDAMNPTGIYNDIFKFCAQKGTFTYEDYIDERVDKATGKKIEVKKQRIKSFEWKEDQYLLLGIDHLYLAKKERSFSTKENMDKISEFLVILRNLFGVSSFVVQQFNQGLNAVDRQKFKGIDLSPSQNDFKDTTNPYQDADVVLGIINPFKLDIYEYQGYDTTVFRDKMISLKIIKNRLERDNISKALLCHPQSGRFEELPKPQLIQYNNYKT